MGDDVALDLAASLYSAAFTAAGADVACEIVRVTATQLEAVVARIRTEPGILGAAVSMPCTVRIAGMLDGLGPEAQVIKAVNTVTRRAGAVVGWNTDRAAFAQAVEEAAFPVKGRSVLLLGAGGAARACADAVRTLAEKVWVAAPDLDEARRLARDLDLTAGGPTPMGGLSLLVKKVDVIVNATPVGSDGKSLLFPIEWISPTQFVFDLVCQPALTPLVRGARERGARAVNGLSMLLFEGLSAVELWTGTPAAEAPVRSSLERAVLERLGP